MIANKVDSDAEEADADEFTRLGLGEAFKVSAEHGRGITDLNEAIDEKLGLSLRVLKTMQRNASVFRFSEDQTLVNLRLEIAC